MFLLPSENIFKGKPYNHLIQWKTLEKVFPWDVFLLLGGSLAMAEGFQVSLTIHATFFNDCCGNIFLNRFQVYLCGLENNLAHLLVLAKKLYY